MRSIQQAELSAAAQFTTNRFWELELFSFLSEGLAFPKETLTLFALSELNLFFSKGDVYVYDENLTGLLAGIPTKKMSIINQLIHSFSAMKILKMIPKDDRKLLLKRNSLLAEIHKAIPCYKKYTKNGYYIGNIVVCESAKGTGVFRKMIMPLIEKCEKERIDIVLETFTPTNIPIYEHFGFKVVEIHSSPKIPFSEYCLIKKVIS